MSGVPAQVPGTMASDLARSVKAPMFSGRRVHVTKSEFDKLSELHDEGTFAAHCGIWCPMEKKLLEVQKKKKLVCTMKLMEPQGSTGKIRKPFF